MNPRSLVIAPLLAVCFQANANGVGENTGWQFRTTAEAANRAYIEDMRMKRVNGFYNAPTYTYNIGTQNNYNCSNTASSAGNTGNSKAAANTPNATGATGASNGNQNAFETLGERSSDNAALNAAQTNAGAVSSSVRGDSEASASFNNSRQVLNTTQFNGGDQTTSMSDAQACQFMTPVAGSSH
jgi:hypothetical protein